jgi:predicted AAA+ superfamily ATPase
MAITRIIPINDILKRKSVLLLGPRKTGKSFFITKQLQPNRYINLLEADTFRKYSARPELLRETLTESEKIIAIDEIQKLPALMDEVHSLIENTKCRFILTGSSARKLSRSHTSLMAGRARKVLFHPLVYVSKRNKRAFPLFCL